MQLEFETQYNLAGYENEFVGYTDLNSLELSGVQSTKGKIISLNKNYSHGVFANVHSHPKLPGTISEWFCFPSDKDFKAKQILGNKIQYLYCGGNFLIKY